MENEGSSEGKIREFPHGFWCEGGLVWHQRNEMPSKLVVYVTDADTDPNEFADAVVQAGMGLKPLSVSRARAAGAIDAVQPRAIVVDSDLAGDLASILGSPRRPRAGLMVLSDRELPSLASRLRKGPSR